MSTTPPDDATPATPNQVPPPAPAAAPAPGGYGIPPEQSPATLSPDAYAAQVAASAVPLPPENVVRGLLLSLLTVPAGIIVFVLVWQLGIVAGIVGFGVAALAFFLYRLGSGGRVTFRGAIIVPVLTLLTLVLAIFSARTFDLAKGYAQSYGLEVWQVLLAADFPSRVVSVFSTSGYLAFLAQNLALPVIFGLIASFAFLRPALKASKDAPVA
ncbi:hypothetical protein [Pseudolysinimonas sp.]|jgi:hypothetical protein